MGYAGQSLVQPVSFEICHDSASCLAESPNRMAVLAPWRDLSGERLDRIVTSVVENRLKDGFAD